jgi:hypothetical protein
MKSKLTVADKLTPCQKTALVTTLASVKGRGLARTINSLVKLGLAVIVEDTTLDGVPVRVILSREGYELRHELLRPGARKGLGL